MVLVAPPAYLTAHIRINSPKTKSTIPSPNTAWRGEEKQRIPTARGIGV